MKLLLLFICLLLTGCHTNSSGFPVIWFMNNGQTHSTSIELPRAVNGDECVACQTNPAVQYVPGPHTTKLVWEQNGFCRGWYFWESKDLANWALVDTVLSYGNQEVTYTRLTTNNPVYWKVSAY